MFQEKHSKLIDSLIKWMCKLLSPLLDFSSPCCCCYLVSDWCLTPCDPVDSSLPGTSVHGIFQTRILEWVAVFYSRGFSPPRDRTCVSCIGRQILYYWATREAPTWQYCVQKSSPHWMPIDFSCSSAVREHLKGWRVPPTQVLGAGTQATVSLPASHPQSASITLAELWELAQ